MTMDQAPIFVGGLSRCGKTLMCSLLSAHPKFAMPHRESNLWAFFYLQYGKLDHGDNLERCLAAMVRYKGVQLLNPNLDRIRSEFWQGEPTYARLFALFHTHYAEQAGKPRWGVQSVSEEPYVDLVLASYPGAQVIHMIRDPRDRYGAQVTTRRPRRRGEVAIATAHWLRSARLPRRHQARYPQQYKIVRYETLVSRPHETMRDVYTFLREDDVPTTNGEKDVFQFKGEQISTAFVECFRQALSTREIAFMQAHTRRDMADYDYGLVPARFSSSDYPLFYLLDQPMNLARMLGWRIWKSLQLRFPAQIGSAPSPHLVSP